MSDKRYLSVILHGFGSTYHWGKTPIEASTRCYELFKLDGFKCDGKVYVSLFDTYGHEDDTTYVFEPRGVYKCDSDGETLLEPDEVVVM